MPYDLHALRANYLEREAIKILSNSKNFKVEWEYTGSVAELMVNDINSRYIIKPIKATIPAYFNQQNLFQLDGMVDVENDTIVYQN